MGDTDKQTCMPAYPHTFNGNMCVYTCEWLAKHIHTHTHTYICLKHTTYIHIHACLATYKHTYRHITYMYVCIDANMHAYIHTSIHTYTDINACMSIYILSYLQENMHAYICACLTTHIHTFIHTNIHMPTRIHTQLYNTYSCMSVYIKSY